MASTIMPPFFVFPEASSNRDIALLQQSFSKAFKYATAGTGLQVAHSPTTISSEMPNYVKQAIGRWMTETQLAGDDRVGKQELDFGGLLLIPRLVVGTTGATEPEASTKPTLLTLPPEMRNRIYRCSLIESQPLTISTAAALPVEPNLLRTCRQIRDEAIAIYYQENMFHIRVHDFDASAYIKWRKASQNRRHAKLRFFIHPSCNWENLLRWLEAYSKGGCRGICSPQSGAHSDAAAPLFRNVARLRRKRCRWKEIKEILEETHTALGLLDDRWK